MSDNARLLTKYTTAGLLAVMAACDPSCGSGISVDQPDANLFKPDAVAPDRALSDVVILDSSRSDLASSDLTSDAGVSDSVTPDKVNPDTSTPDSFNLDSFTMDSFTMDSVAPDAFAPDAFITDAFAPDAFSPDAFNPDSFTPDSLITDAFSPDTFIPDAFSPDAFSPDSFTPDTFTPDMASSEPCVGVEIHPGDDVQAVMSSHGSGTTFCLSAGLYRLEERLSPGTGDVLWGAPGARLNGARVLEGWSADGGDWYVSGALPSPYTGTGDCEDDITYPCRLAEWLFRDGEHLTRVMSRADLEPGNFYGDYSANRVYIGEEPGGHLWELSRTDYAIRSGASDVTVRGLIIEMFATQAQHGALEFTGPGWEIHDNELRHNHGTGVRDYGTLAHIHHNWIHHNGQLGIGGWRSTGTVIEHNEIAHNNTDGFWVMDWEGGGIKFTESSLLIRHNHVHHNLCVGIWLDIDCYEVEVHDNLVEDNAADGIRYEISYDGVIHDNQVFRNSLGIEDRRDGGASIYYGAGITVNTSSRVELYGNELVDNQHGFSIQRRDRGAHGMGVHTLEGVHVHHNTVTLPWGQSGLVKNHGGDEVFSSMGNSFSSNSYLLDALEADRFQWLGSARTAAEWQAYGQDVDGSFGVIP